MDLKDKVVVVTGAGSGIGRALCERFADEVPRSITALDLHADTAKETAELIQARHPQVSVYSDAVDVADEGALVEALGRIGSRDGVIDVFVSNAGIGSGAGIDAANETWRRVIDINLMSHVYAARTLLPAWLERGFGHMVITASAAGLLTNLGDASYSVTKHGAVAVAEWLAVTYAHRGIGVSCLCPQGVRTPLLFPDGVDSALALKVVRSQRILEAADVADATVRGLAEGTFLILPHPEVHDYEMARASDRERWLRAMNRMQVVLESPEEDTQR